ncbi:DUF167 domain-containing protein [Patescibacteria group bacterium]|nr:DUF167 domain-containing protein [Patescibacteria group bacterium]
MIKVKVFPSAGKQEIIKKSEDSFEIWVKEKPIQGQANRAVISALAGYLEIPRENIRLIKGFKQRNKIFKINGFNHRPIKKRILLDFKAGK